MTFNLWNTEFLEERKESLRDFFTLFDADIICLQEVRPENLALLDEFLPTHARFHEASPNHVTKPRSTLTNSSTEAKKDDEEYITSWEMEGNIYYRTSMFVAEQWGEESVGMFEPHRRLFWARLRLTSPSNANSSHVGEGASILVSTIHMTWEGHDVELITGQSPRIDITNRVLDFLSRHTYTSSKAPSSSVSYSDAEETKRSQPSEPSGNRAGPSPSAHASVQSSKVGIHEPSGGTL